MASPSKKPCTSCKSTVEVLNERLDLHRKDIQALAAHVAALELTVTRKAGRVELPSGLRIVKTPEENTVKLWDEPMTDTPEAKGLEPAEALTGLPRKR